MTKTYYNKFLFIKTPYKGFKITRQPFFAKNSFRLLDDNENSDVIQNFKENSPYKDILNSKEQLEQNISSTKITFRKVEDYSYMWVWVEFSDYPTNRVKENFEDAIKSFYITGKLGGFNSLNLQIFYAGEVELSWFKYNNEEIHSKIPACFHELGTIEFKGCWTRFFLDMGTTDELSIDILINVLIGFSKDFATITQVILGGENIDWTTPTSPSRLRNLFSNIRETGLAQDEILTNFNQLYEKKNVSQDPLLQGE
jgi:hypothetical protein